MKSASGCLSVMMFWIENIPYLLGFLLYEIVLMPLIFFKVLFNIIRLSSWLKTLPTIIVWVLIGLFILIFNIIKDVFYFLGLLCNY
jgi:hypothetical protein